MEKEVTLTQKAKNQIAAAEKALAAVGLDLNACVDLVFARHFVHTAKPGESFPVLWSEWMEDADAKWCSQVQVAVEKHVERWDEQEGD